MIKKQYQYLYGYVLEKLMTYKNKLPFLMV